MIVYIRKAKPDHGQLVFAYNCIFNMLGILDQWGLTTLGQFRLEQASLRSQNSTFLLCDCLNSLEYILLPCMVNLAHLVNQADLIRIVQILLDPGLSQTMYPLLCHMFVPRTGDEKRNKTKNNKITSGSFCFGTAWTSCNNKLLKHEAVLVCVHECECMRERARERD